MNDLSRRSFVKGALAAAGASIAPPPALASIERAIPAKTFVDAIGICTHPNWRETLWGRTDWNAAFLDAGVMHTRGKIGRGSIGRAALADLQKLFANGVKICVTIAENSGADFDLAATKASLDFLANEVGAQNLSGIESANEYNNPRRRPADWAVRLRTFQKWLHDTVRDYPVFDHVPLVAPSIWGRLTNDYLALGDLEPNVDRGCMHYYTGGRRPSKVGLPRDRSEEGGAGDRNLSDAIREAKVLAPTKPLWITEFGYPVAGPGLALSGSFISTKAAAKYVIRGLFDAIEQGVEKIFIYSLLDDVHRSPPRYHGLMDYAVRPRQTYHAVKNLIALFADKGVLPNPQRLEYAVSNITGSTKQLLFQKSDGSFLLTMYQDVDSYSRSTRQDITLAPVDVRLSLAQSASKIEVFTPTLTPAATGRVANVDRLIVSVSDHVTVVKITPRN